MQKHRGERVSSDQGSSNLSTVARKSKVKFQSIFNFISGKWEPLRDFTEEGQDHIYYSRKWAVLERGL